MDERVKTTLIILVIALAITGLVFGYLAITVEKTDVAVVTDKYFTPAHTTTIYLPIKIGNITTFVPQITHHPDSWTIVVGSETCGQQHYAVSQAYYDKAVRGTTTLDVSCRIFKKGD